MNNITIEPKQTLRILGVHDLDHNLSFKPHANEILKVNVFVKIATLGRLKHFLLNCILHQSNSIKHTSYHCSTILLGIGKVVPTKMESEQMLQ